MENKHFYAVMMDNEDCDWSYGSYDLAEAQKMLEHYRADYPDSYIAVIEMGHDPICVDELRD